jgi:hypothetical protein
MRDKGYHADVCECYNFFTKRRRDLYGILDIVAIKKGETVGVQTTSKANMAARRNKIRESGALHLLVEAGWKVEIHGWFKKKNRWQVKISDPWEPK